MLQSMTGYADAKGAAQGFTWAWDLRGVNAKGLDLRVRVPDWIEGLEPALRSRLSAALGRGSVTLSLRLTRDEAAGGATLNRPALKAALAAVAEVEQAACDAGVALAPVTAADILAQRGVLDAAAAIHDSSSLRKLLEADLQPLLEAFIAMRKSEGAALEEVLARQLDEIETLTARAAEAAEARKPEVAATLRRNLALVLDNSDGADAGRVAQELAMLAVKADVTEEIDRLAAHVTAARDLIAKGSPVGRKLDFLMQEFNREANTVCSKAGSAPLTAIGLDLKAVIDQMREQVQNVE